MEHSIPSSMNNCICSKELTAAAEESGWTLYLDDFLSSQNEEAASSNFSSTIGGDGGGSSMVSDAASYVPWTSVETSDGPKKLSFKKKKERKASVDDSLEDTASFPVSSPKVKDYDHMDMNTDKKVDTEIFQGNGYNNYQETEICEIREASVAERGYDCNELRKKGLCLLPLSTLLDYLG